MTLHRWGKYGGIIDPYFYPLLDFWSGFPFTEGEMKITTSRVITAHHIITVEVTSKEEDGKTYEDELTFICDNLGNVHYLFEEDAKYDQELYDLALMKARQYTNEHWLAE